MGINDGKTRARNTLLLKEQGGHLRVYSLELASLGTTLVYDRGLARKTALEALAHQNSRGNVGETLGGTATERIFHAWSPAFAVH